MMNIAVDTNVLIRLFVGDDEAQQRAAIDILNQATSVFVATAVLYEVVWVLLRSYKMRSEKIADILEDFVLNVPNLKVAHDEVMAGLAFLRAGGDFADGDNAFLGMKSGATHFVTFDKKAAHLLKNNHICDVILLK